MRRVPVLLVLMVLVFAAPFASAAHRARAVVRAHPPPKASPPPPPPRRVLGNVNDGVAALPSTADVAAAVAARGLQAVTDVLRPFVVAKMQHREFDWSQDGMKDYIHYHLNNLVLRTFNLTAATIDTQDDELALTLTGLAAFVTLDYEWQETVWPNPSGSGTAYIRFSGDSHASASANLSVNATGLPTLAILSASVTLDKFEVAVSDPASEFMVKLLGECFQDSIRKQVEDGLSQSLVVQGTSTANALLSRWPLALSLNNDAPQLPVQLSINLTATGTEVSADTGVLTVVDGTVYDPDLPPAPAAPRRSPPVPLPIEPGTHDVVAAVSDDVLNSALATLHTAGALQAHFDQSNWPAEIPFSLNTTDWSDMAPPMCVLYPANAMRIFVHSDVAPTAQIVANTSSVFVHAHMLADFEVQDLLSKWLPAFTLAIDIAAEMNVNVNNSCSPSRVVLSLLHSSAELSLAAAPMGTFDVSNMQQIVDIATVDGGMVEQQVDAMLGDGVAVPVVMGLELANFQLDIHDRFLVLFADIQPIATFRQWFTAVEDAVRLTRPSRATHPRHHHVVHPRIRRPSRAQPQPPRVPSKKHQPARRHHQ